MTYSEILQELQSHEMNDYFIERYEIEKIAPDNYIAHIVLDGQNKKAYITAEVQNLVQTRTRNAYGAYGGKGREKLIELSGPITELGLNAILNFREGSSVSLYFVNKERKGNAIR